MKVAMGNVSFRKEELGCVRMRDEMINCPLYFNRKEYWCTCIALKDGTRHCVIPMDQIAMKKVCEIGSYAENSSYFSEGISAEIVKVLDQSHILMECYKKGQGYVLYSESAACAAAGAVWKLGMTGRKIWVSMPGGKVLVEIEGDGEVFCTSGLHTEIFEDEVL